VSKTPHPTIYIHAQKSHHKKRQNEKKRSTKAKTRPAKGGRRYWSRRVLVAERAFLLREGWGERGVALFLRLLVFMFL
jgi:hypothetical protein